MTETLAEVLVQIDDPETIEKLLVAAGVNNTSARSVTDNTEQKTLSSLFDRYLDRRQNRSPATRAQYKRTIPHFVDFADENGVPTSTGITAQLVDDYVKELQDEFGPDATILTYTKNVRAWLRWLSKRQLCEEQVYRILDKDELGLSPKARDEALPEQTAKHILQYLRQRRRGSAIHAVLELLWNAGPRVGGVHSLDLRDFRPEDNTILFRHRPNTGTRLKNGSEDTQTSGDGERDNEVSDTVVQAIMTYIQNDRPEITDEYGREPLFATKYGRAARSTIRRWVYEATSCRWAPTNSNAKTCEGACDPDSNVCPHSYYPHSIRRGAIVNHLSGGLRPDRASERFDVSTKILKRYYDPRTKSKRKEDRSEAVRSAWSG